MWAATPLHVLLLLAAVVSAQWQSTWGRCGGDGYSGPTQCPPGTSCLYANPWYSQCTPPEQSQPGYPGAPDSPIATSTVTTIVTVMPGPNPIVVTTWYTFLTPRPTAAPAPSPSITVIDGTTWSIIGRRSPVTEALDVQRRDPEPTAEVGARDVDRPPVYDAPLAQGFVRKVEVGKRDVDRAPVYDSPLAQGFVRTLEFERRDVDRPPVYDAPLAQGFVRKVDVERRDVDRPPVYDAPLASGFVRKVKPGSKRDVGRAPVYDSALAKDFARKVE